MHDCLERVFKYLQDEDSVVKLLYLLPNLRQGLGPILEGIYSSNQELALLCAKIVSKLQNQIIGKMAVRNNITVFHQLKMSELLAQNCNSV